MLNVTTPPVTATPNVIVRDPVTWGAWTLRQSNLTLEFERDRHSYWVDLEDMTDSAQVLDWIAQVAGKSWATPEDLGNLVLAINDLLQPQSRLCSAGAHRTIEAGEIPAIVRASALQVRANRRLDAEIAAGTWPKPGMDSTRGCYNMAELHERMVELEREEGP